MAYPKAPCTAPNVVSTNPLLPGQNKQPEPGVVSMSVSIAVRANAVQ